MNASFLTTRGFWVRFAMPAALLAGAALALYALAPDRGVRDPREAARPRPPGVPAAANWELHEDLIAAIHAAYHPADGGGSARLLEAPDAIRAAESGEFLVEYTAGRLGIAPGGKLYFQVSPFWGWSDPQLGMAGAPGYAAVEVHAAQARLRTEEAGGGALVMHVEGGALREGETVRIRYGIGGTARVDRYADDIETFHLWVDGDGDGQGTRRLVEHDMRVVVGAREPDALLVTLPCTARVGQEFEGAVAVLDAGGNAAGGFAGTVVLHHAPALEVQDAVELGSDDGGARRFRATAREEGIFYVIAEHGDLTARSNPVLVSARPRPTLWADLQIHTGLSDGTGSPEAAYRYARDVARLDVAAVTDHDHHGMHKLDESPELWDRVRAANAAFHEPGRFVTVLGYEWTSWIWGHRHVLYFGDEGRVFSAVRPPTDTPQGLWQALRGMDAITIPHHPAGGAQALEWSVRPDPDLEPVVEIVSVHGSSESMDGPLAIHRPVEGHFVRDALARGYRLGFVGSTDGHDGHPGLAHWNAPSGGIAALLTTDHTRAGVRDALKQRRCYATSGARIYLEFSLGAHAMGSIVAPPAAGSAPLAYRVYVLGTAPIAAVELIKNGQVLAHHEPAAEADPAAEPGATPEPPDQATLLFVDADRRRGDHVYARVLQLDRHVAYSSPIWTE